MQNKITNPMHLWFMYLFEQRMDKNGYVKCYESGKRMHEDDYKDLSSCYSHIFPKKRFPQYAGDPDNVVIVKPEYHDLYEKDKRNTPKQYALYLKLKEKYDL